MAAMAMRLTPKVRISPPVIGGEWRAVWCDLHQKPANSVPNDRSLPDTVRGVTLVWHQSAVPARRMHLQRARHLFPDTRRIRPFTGHCPEPGRPPVHRRGQGAGNVLAPSGRAVRVTGGERWSARLAGRGSGAHIGPPNGGDTR
jgi:hypothetical protein